MDSFREPKDVAKKIQETSPLFNYWDSEQNNKDEGNRLQICNNAFPASGLFKKEPYKWEMLYQSIIRELRSGDKDSIKGLRLLIQMLIDKEQEQVLKSLSKNNLLSEVIISKLKQEEDENIQTKKNFFRFTRILFAIFTNPYRIEIKREKTHIYEKTGSILNTFRNSFKSRS